MPSQRCETRSAESRSAETRSASNPSTLPARDDVTGLVFCGGDSRRMGQDKALLEIDGVSLLSRAAGVLDGVAARVHLACGSRPRYGHLGRPLELDRVADGGPLAGLDAGLAAARREGTEWVVALACDMPRVERGVLRALLRRAHAEGLDLCLPRSVHGLEPLCAVYRRTCAEAVEAALAAGERRMVSFWQGPWAESRSRIGARSNLAVGELLLDAAAAQGPEADGARGGYGADATWNVNTPADLEEERKHCAESGS